MRRALALALLLSVAPAGAHALDDWRPPQPDRLAALDAALAPTLSQVADAVAAIQQDLGIITEFVTVSTVEGTRTDLAARLAALDQLARDIEAASALARDGIAVTRQHPPEPCWAEYHAVTVAGLLLLGDAAQSLALGDFTSANRQVGAALYLLGDYGDVVHAQAERDCEQGGEGPPAPSSNTPPGGVP